MNIKNARYSSELASFIVSMEEKKTKASTLSILNPSVGDFLHPKDSNGAIKSYEHNFLFQKYPSTTIPSIMNMITQAIKSSIAIHVR